MNNPLLASDKNKYGFSARLAGYRGLSGGFGSSGSNAYLWASSQNSSTHAWSRGLGSGYFTVYRGARNKPYGFSVRLLKDSSNSSDSFTDERDGTIYPLVKIGSQVWMAKNLAYLPKVNKSDDGSVDKPKYYIYNFEGTDVKEAKKTENYKVFGVLYNWKAAMESAPEGFHLPSDEEFTELTDFIKNEERNVEETNRRDKIFKFFVDKHDLSLLSGQLSDIENFFKTLK